MVEESRAEEESTDLVLKILLLFVGILLIAVSILMLTNVYITRKNRQMFLQQAE